jgi:hypothetical protein
MRSSLSRRWASYARAMSAAPRTSRTGAHGVRSRAAVGSRTTAWATGERTSPGETVSRGSWTILTRGLRALSIVVVSRPQDRDFWWLE